MVEGDVPEQESGGNGRGSGGGWTLLLMLVPVAAYIYPPLYQRVEPSLGGIPFAIWYQFAWVLVGVAVTGFAYWWHDLRLRDGGDDAGVHGGGEDR